MFQDFTAPKLTMSHAVAAATVAGLFGLWLWVKKFQDVGPEVVADSLRSGNRLDEITVVGSLPFILACHRALCICSSTVAQHRGLSLRMLLFPKISDVLVLADF
jgi:hypothetical protein